MKVAQIWRYPIKSMAGERLTNAHGHVITARTPLRLLGRHAKLNAPGEPVVDGLL